MQVPSNREILHVVPRDYIVDGQEEIKDPLGMSAVRLEVETHIVAGAATSVQNLSKCIVSSGVQIDEMVISSLAAGEATLTDTEKELGVLVADIGGGTTDIAIFVDGSVYHTAVLPSTRLVSAQVARLHGVTRCGGRAARRRPFWNLACTWAQQGRAVT